jgi:PAS domain S-box-containing protein
VKRLFPIACGGLAAAAALAGAGLLLGGAPGALPWACLAAGLGAGGGLLAAAPLRRRAGADAPQDGRDSEALFRNLFEVSPFPAAVTRLDDGTVLAVNQRVVARFGVRTEDALGAQARDFYAVPEDRDRLIAAVRTTGRADELLVRLKAVSGETFWAALSARQVTYRGVPAMLSVFHDVDARIKAEEALRESEQRLTAHIEALTELTSTGASGGVRFDDRLRRILESCARTIGVARASVWRFACNRSAISCSDLYEAAQDRHSSGVSIPRAGHEAYFGALERERLIAADDAPADPRTREFRDGYLVPLGIGAMLDVPLRQDDLATGVLCLEHVGGKRAWTVDEQNFALSVANVIAAAAADEERRAALRDLAESEQRARLVLDTATDAFVGMDSEGRIASWNTQAEHTFGWSREEAIGLPLATTIIPPQLRESHLRGMWHFHQTGEAPVVNQRLELVALHRDGREFPVELSISEPIRQGDGFYFGAFLRDITEPRRRQEELRQAKESAEAAARAKSEFLANMSHELRTPLNGVLGYAQLLRRDRTLAAEHREAVDNITACGAHLLDLINDVLDLSKIEAGRVEVEAASTELQQLVADLGLLIAEPARKKGLRFDADVARDLPRRVVLDGRHLRQVLLNLLGNAVKFTDRGSVRLTVARDGPASVRFDVIDTGIGVEPEEQQAIFEAFRQTRRGAQAGGSGLGLAISRRLVRAMGGELRVESAVGRGSRFWFTVPLVAGASDEEAAAAERGTDLRLAPGQEVTVLVVDDSTINRRIMASLLESAGIRTLRAASGAEGLAIAERHHPDLVLMDLRMADMDGFEATRRLEASAATAGIPVIAVTASPGDDARGRALAAGCRDFLPKPLRAGELYEMLSRHLHLRFEPIEAAAEEDAEVFAPPPDVAERVRRAAAIGNLSELHAIAQELMSGDDSRARLGRELGRLANAFDFEALERLCAPVGGAA